MDQGLVGYGVVERSPESAITRLPKDMLTDYGRPDARNLFDRHFCPWKWSYFCRLRKQISGIVKNMSNRMAATGKSAPSQAILRHLGRGQGNAGAMPGRSMVIIDVYTALLSDSGSTASTRSPGESPSPPSESPGRVFFRRRRRRIGGGGITTITGLPSSSASPCQPHVRHPR